MNDIQKKLIKSYVDRLDVYLDPINYNEETMRGLYVLVNPDSQKIVGIISITSGLVESAVFDGNYFNFNYIGFHNKDKHDRSVISDYILSLLYDKGILQYRTIDYNYVGLSFNLSSLDYVVKSIENGSFIKL